MASFMLWPTRTTSGIFGVNMAPDFLPTEYLTGCLKPYSAFLAKDKFRPERRPWIRFLVTLLILWEVSTGLSLEVQRFCTSSASRFS